MKGNFACVVVLCLISVCYSAKITQLPSLTFTPNFNQYSGYITLNSTNNENMFYWFVESQNNPSTDPLIIWLQGGPGCSGLLGFFQEHGPFLINTDGNLVQNPYSWNRLANIVYIESPIGVGFSYSDNSNDYITNDNQTAAQNYQFLQLFLQQYPQFASNEFWITGESYAGVYGPMLANLIVTGSNTQLKNNFQGYSLGNPVTSCPELKTNDLGIQINTFYWNGLLGIRQLREWEFQGCAESEFAPGCGKLYEKLVASIGQLAGDDLYENFCTGNGTLDAFEQTPNCVTLTDRTIAYLNRADVQAAIFAKPQIWMECGNPRLHYSLQGQNMMKYYENFFQIAPQLHIMVYSGDIDISTVPHAKTQLCLEGLKRPLVQEWRPWTVQGPASKNVTAGYVEVYDTYTFATVKGAGHEVPQYQPVFAFNLYERFVINKSKSLNP